MFSFGHILWLVFSAVIILAGLYVCFHYKPSIDRVLTVCCVLAIISELIKLISSIEMQPILEMGSQMAYQATGRYVPYLENGHLPLELCSLQIFFIFIARFLKEGERKNHLLTFMYVTEVIGATLALLLPEFLLDEEYDSVAALFLVPRNYQYFFWHSMLIVLGIYIAFGNVIEMKKSYFLHAVLGIALLDICSFYLNSLLATPVYSDGQLVGISNTVNFFSSYFNPLGIVITEKIHWIYYLIIRLVCALICISAATAAALWKHSKKHYKKHSKKHSK